MAEIETAIYSKLSGHAGLAALVVARIFPNVVPQNTANPCVRYQLVSSSEPQAMGSGTGIIRSRFQFSVYHDKDNYKQAKAVMTQIKDALKRWSDAGSDPVVQDTFFLNENDLYDSQTEEHQIVADFEIIYTEA